MATLTPYEAFIFVANLKIKGSKENKVKRVEDLLSELKLDDCKNTMIGDNFMKGISGGERKRTSIGVELITDPRVLFLDEPTTGLDSFTAWVIITNLKNLAKTKNMTVIFTIHQPSSDIFRLFDRLLLMLEGRVIYQGYVKYVIDYFASINFQCPIHSNPADYFMSLISTINPKDPKIRERFTLFFTAYDQNVRPDVDE